MAMHGVASRRSIHDAGLLLGHASNPAASCFSVDVAASMLLYTEVPRARRLSYRHIEQRCCCLHGIKRC